MLHPKGKVWEGGGGLAYSFDLKSPSGSGILVYCIRVRYIERVKKKGCCG